MKSFVAFKTLAAALGLVFVSQAAMASYFCTIDSSFDGSFSGKGETQLEAKTEAKAACKVGSRNNGFFCDDNSLTCEGSDGGRGDWHRPREEFHCTIDSSFDGSFGGGGWTRLEAETNAKQSCKEGSRNNGFFCDANSLRCDSSRN